MLVCQKKGTKKNNSPRKKKNHKTDEHVLPEAYGDIFCCDFLFEFLLEVPV